MCLVVQLGFASPLAEGRLLVREAIDHVIRHPSLEVNPRLVPAVRHALPSFEGNEMFAFLRGGEASAEQSRLDVLVSRSFDRLDAHPYRALGLVPAHSSWLAIATYGFVHGGWIHTLLTCLLLLAAGPLLEVAWGRRLFGAACVLAAFVGAGVFRLLHADLDRALVGGGALVSALVAGAVVRFWNQDVDLASWLAPLTRLELRVPSWSLAPAWAIYQAALVWAARGDLPGGLQNAQGIAASLGAAAAGAGIAVGLARSGLEARFGSRPEAVSARTARGRFDIEKVKRARARGDLETAFQLLRAETRRSARNRDVVLLFWEIAVEHDQAETAAPTMLQLIREELRRGALDAAVAQWRRLGERVPGALLDPATLLKLLPLIRSKLGDDTAVLALHQAVDPSNRGFTPELGAEIARKAAEIEPEVARKAASRTLRATGIAPELASEMNDLLLRLQPPCEDDEMGDLPPVASASFDDDDEHDRSAFGAVNDLSAEPEPKKKAPPPRKPRRRHRKPRRRRRKRGACPRAGGRARNARGRVSERARRHRGAGLARRGGARDLRVRQGSIAARLQPHHGGVAGSRERAGPQAGGAPRPAAFGPSARPRAARAGAPAQRPVRPPQAGGVLGEPPGGPARAGRGAAQAHAGGAAPGRSDRPRPAAAQVRLARGLLGRGAARRLRCGCRLSAQARVAAGR